MRRCVCAVIAVRLFTAGTAGAVPSPAWQGPCPGATVAATGDPQVAELLRGISQRLLDAVGAGDTAVWTRYLDDQGIFVDEEGIMRNKPGLIAELRPLPPGISGRICVTAPRATVLETVAVLTYDAMETASVYGQELRTHYHTTDTYVRRGPEWRLLGSHTAVLPSEHTAAAVRPESLDDFIGVYILAPGREYRVTRDGNRLFGSRAADHREELLPLGGDRFFRTGARRGERIFRRDASGNVDAMLDRRDNNDLVWKRAVHPARGQ